MRQKSKIDKMANKPKKSAPKKKGSYDGSDLVSPVIPKSAKSAKTKTKGKKKK